MKWLAAVGRTSNSDGPSDRLHVYNSKPCVRLCQMLAVIRRTFQRSFHASKAGCWGILCIFTWFGLGKALAAWAWYRYTSNTLAMKISRVGIVSQSKFSAYFSHFMVSVGINYFTLIPLSVYWLSSCLDDQEFECLQREDIFSSPKCPTRYWGQLSLLFSMYRGYSSGVEWPVREYDILV